MNCKHLPPESWMTCAETCVATCTWRLTPSFRTLSAFSTGCAWACKKSSSPANEIRREQDERLLKSDGRFGTHFEMVQGEHLLALFNASLNRLPTVVLLEPPRQLLCHRVRTEMNQGTLLLISRPVLETTLASLECIWRFCQCMYTSCPRLTFFSPCLLHTFTQHSL